MSSVEVHACSVLLFICFSVVLGEALHQLGWLVGLGLGLGWVGLVGSLPES